MRELPALDGLNRILVLNCGHPGITLLPVSLERLSSLRELDLSDNHIETFPYLAISRLHKLELLDLSLGRRPPLEGHRIFEEVLPQLKHLTVLYAHLDCFPRLDSNYLNSLERMKKISLSASERYLVAEIVVNEECVHLRAVTYRLESGLNGHYEKRLYGNFVLV